MSILKIGSSVLPFYIDSLTNILLDADESPIKISANKQSLNIVFMIVVHYSLIYESDDL